LLNQLPEENPRYSKKENSNLLEPLGGGGRRCAIRNVCWQRKLAGRPRYEAAARSGLTTKFERNPLTAVKVGLVKREITWEVRGGFCQQGDETFGPRGGTVRKSLSMKDFGLRS